MTLSREDSPAIQRWLVFAIAGSGIFLATSGISVVNVALPFITQDLGADITTAQWILLAYLLTTSTLLINFGRLGDLLGSYRVHNAGLLIFTLSSLLCSLSTSTMMLLGFRTLQAVGGAMVIANGPATVTSIFPASQRGRVLGLQVTLLGIALSVGPTIGGLLIGAFGWRSVFLYNVPFGLGGLLLTRLAKVPSQERKRVQVDLPGSILLFLAVASFVLATNRARDWSWSAPGTLLLLGIFLLSSAAFLIVERLSSRPMLDLKLFRNRVFALAQAGNFIAHLSTFGVIFLMPFYLVRILKMSAEASGLMLLPLTVTMIVLGPVSGFFSDRFGTKWPSVSGMALLCLGLYSLTSLDERSSIASVVLRLALLGGGRAIYGSPNQSATMGAVNRERLGVAGGIFATMRHLGNISGLALTGSYFSARLASHLQQQGAAPGAEMTESSFLAAFHDTFFLCLWVAAAGLITALLQKEIGEYRGRAVEPSVDRS
jgi:EmrB/QacA subfamily drug resistance transporter